jgi:hypothetical protein
MKQKLWEQKHRLGSFRRRAKLPAPRETDPLMAALSPERYTTFTDQPLQPVPSTPQFPPLGSVSLLQASGRRLSDAGILRSDLFRPPSTPLDRGPRDRRSSSPMRYDQDTRVRRRSPSLFEEEEEDLLRSLSPVRYDRSPARSRRGSEVDGMGRLSPLPPGLREAPSRDFGMGILSPRRLDGRSTSPRTGRVFFPDSEFSPLMREVTPPERLTTDWYPDATDEPPYMLPHEIPTRERDPDTESAHSGEDRMETRL